MRQKHTARAGQLKRLVGIIAENPGITTRQLAMRSGMSYSPHFRGLVRELYDTQAITGIAITLPNGFPEYQWTVIDASQN